ncbi:MAG: hypothetical protein AMS21_10905 [Gemmatimonas sp. SG8_38_2]|nr:MAG: hypothetical protein AMS21_10905 [Gemmatimonas sp. SG8_38_2]
MYLADDISSALKRALIGCSFSVIVLASLMLVRGRIGEPLAAIVVYIGFVLAIATFSILTYLANRQSA